MLFEWFSTSLDNYWGVGAVVVRRLLCGCFMVARRVFSMVAMVFWGFAMTL